MSQTFCFSVQADAAPSTLPRVLDVFALFGHVPDHSYSRLAGPAEMVIDVQMSGLDRETAERIAGKLGRIVSVGSVLWSEKRSVAAA